MSKLRAGWLLVFIVMVAIALRSLHLESRSIWFDEAFSWRLVQFPLIEMIARDAADVHPPLYYVLLKVWVTVFGSSVTALRSFSIAAAAMTVGAVYGFATYAFSKRSVGLLAALLVAVAGLQIQIAEEARMYALGTLGAVLTTWLLLRVIREEKPIWGWVIAYGVTTALFAYIHYYAFFSIAAQALFVIGYLSVATRGRVGEILQWRLTWRMVTAGMVAALLYAPWVPYFLQQQAQVQAAFWIPPLDRWSLPDTAYRMLLPALTLPRSYGGLWVGVSLLPLAGLSLIGLWLAVQTLWQRETTSRATWLVVISGVVPVLLAAAVSLGGRSVYQDRYLVFAHIFLMISVAVVLLQLRPKMVRRALIGLVILGMLASQWHYWQELDTAHKPGVRGAAAMLFGQRQDDEGVIVSSPFVFFPLLHYAAEAHDARNAVRLYSATGEVIHFAGGPVLVPDNTVSASVFEDSSRRVLWVVDTTGFGGAVLPVPAPWHATATTSFREVFGYQGDIILTRYQRP